MFKQAASLVAEKGYRQVMTFQGGIPAWIKAGYPIDQSGSLGKEKAPSVSVDELNGMLGQVVVPDIRPESLYEMGWIPGSANTSAEEGLKQATEARTAILDLLRSHKQASGNAAMGPALEKLAGPWWRRCSTPARVC